MFPACSGPRSACPGKAMGKEGSCWEKMHWDDRPLASPGRCLPCPGIKMQHLNLFRRAKTESALWDTASRAPSQSDASGEGMEALR